VKHRRVAKTVPPPALSGGPRPTVYKIGNGPQAARSKRDRPERASELAYPVSHVRAAAGCGLEYARHGRSIGGGSPLEEEVVLTPSRRQLRRREAGWEGSPRRISAPRNTNRVEGGAIWVSLLKKAKPVTINRVVA
jgi:hypothetical protein